MKHIRHFGIIGNAANFIAGSRNLFVSDDTRKKYKSIAMKYFEKYEELNRFNILREDVLVSSCALEHADLLLSEAQPDVDRVEKLLKQAVDSSGNAFDIPELCAITYLKIGSQKEAARLLRILVNEDYNKIINAQLLSSIYVYQHNKPDYDLLVARVDKDYLYPMPAKEDDLAMLQSKFEGRQKSVLKSKFKSVIEELLDKYTIQWNRVTSVFDINEEYPDSFFLDTERAKAERRRYVGRVYADDNKKEYYQNRMAESDYESNILNILNDICSNVFSSTIFADSNLQERVEQKIRSQISDQRDAFNAIQESMKSGEFSMDKYIFSQEITFRRIVGNAFDIVIQKMMDKADAANINEIAFLESQLRDFCISNNLDEPEIAVSGENHFRELFEKRKEPFGLQLFGKKL